jgi:hypothetical protein
MARLGWRQCEAYGGPGFGPGLAVFDEAGIVRAGMAAENHRNSRISRFVHVLDIGIIRCI